MAFEWPRFDVYEDNFERGIRSETENQVLHYYGVDDIADLTPEQINQVEDFSSRLNPQSIMLIGFRELINTWEDSRDE